MNNRIIITKYNEKIIILFLSDSIPVKIFALNRIDEMAQSVYLGRVENVKSNISSCFVKYNNTTGFLKSKDIKAETILPVMLKKETAKGKEDEVTDKISVSGLYLVVSDDFTGVKYSNRLNDTDRLRFKRFNFNNVIIRNNARYIDDSSLINEYNLLKEKLLRISSIKDKRVSNSLLYEGIPKIIEVIFSENITEFPEIITDIEDAYNYINNYFKAYKSESIDIPLNLRLYNDDSVSLAALVSLSSKLGRALDKKVFLKSDAYIVFDYTEAMTVIDVNSGTTVHKGDKSDVIHKINLEAVKEIALQLKLRNLSGIIIIDFINEYKREYKEELLYELNKQLMMDDCHAKCHGITKLGLIEVTRNRKYKPLFEQLWK